ARRAAGTGRRRSVRRAVSARGAGGPSPRSAAGARRGPARRGRAARSPSRRAARRAGGTTDGSRRTAAPARRPFSPPTTASSSPASSPTAARRAVPAAPSALREAIPGPRLRAAVALDGGAGGRGHAAQHAGADAQQPAREDPREGVVGQPRDAGAASDGDRALEVA